MPNSVTLYPIYWLAREIDGDEFDRSVLPMQILEGLAVEDVSTIITPDSFDWARTELGRYAFEDLRNVKQALVHRYQTGAADGAKRIEESEMLVRDVVACLRLIRPMRQRVFLVRGDLRENGTLDVRHFEHPRDVEVPEVQKLFSLRTRDVELLQALAGSFSRAMRGQFWKFRMAVQFHETGHFQDSFWKTRFLMWCAGIEALFTSPDRQHRGSVVAKERIGWFLGQASPLYEPGDIPAVIPQPDLTIGDILDDLYRVRNFVAHGERVPDEYFQRILRRGLNADLPVVPVLIEAVSFILRKSLLRILRDNLLHSFANAATANAYFAAAGLTLREIERKRQVRADDEE